MRSLRISISLAVVVTTVLSVAIASSSGNPSQQSVSVHLTLGNPSDATTDESDKNNFLMVKPQYALSFNNRRGGPNWVSWHLEARDIGGQDRGDFHPDESLPDGFNRIVKDDYTNTGFDRGHVCNSKDRTNTRRNNDATFLMTNILPQSPDSNQGPWRRLEDFERKLARDGNELYIIAGAFGSGGSGEIQVKRKRKIIRRIPVSANEIAEGKVTVPKIFWKIMVVIRRGNNDLSRINADTRTIAVCMPNRQGTRRADWHTFITTIRKVEAATGYDFLSELPSRLQDEIETRRDSSATGPTNRNPCR